jgi:hypothetical protein
MTSGRLSSVSSLLAHLDRSDENEGDRRAAAEIASLFPSSQRSVPSLAADGRVAAFGRKTLAAARLHARLTGRQVTLVSSVKELARHEDVAVVVVAAQDLGSDLLSALYLHGAGDAPGIISAADPVSLRRQALVRATAACLCVGLQAQSNPRSLLVAPDFLTGLHLGPHTWQLGRGTPPRLLDGALGLGADMLILMAHSDGFDARLLEDRVLCCLKGSELTGGVLERDAPLCRQTGQCHRQPSTVTAVMEDATFLSVLSLRARILIYFTCWGIRVQSDPVHVRWSLGEQLRNSTTLGAIVTTWGRTIFHNQLVMQLQRAVGSGVPLGRAVAEVNRRWGRKGAALCILGDPTVCVPPWVGDLPAPGDVPAAAEPLAASEGNDHPEFFRVMAQATTRWSVRRSQESLADQLKANALNQPGLDPALDLLCAYREPSDVWLTQLAGSRGSDGVCPNCAAPVVELHARTAQQTRHFTTCGQCDLVQDLPFPGAVTVVQTSAHQVQLRIAPALLSEGYQGRFIVRSWDDVPSTVLELTAGNSMPPGLIALPDNQGPGPLTASLRLVWGRRAFAAVSFRLRRSLRRSLLP